MKNVIKLLFVTFVLLGLSSCSQIMYGDGLGEGAESVAFSFRAPSGGIENGKLTLSISDGNKTETFETGFSGGSVSHEFKKIPVRKKISIYAKLEKTIIKMPAAPNETELLYEGATDIVTKRGKNVVNLGLEPFSGYFLWAGNNSPAYGKVFYQNISEDLTAPFLECPISFTDFCFAENGDLWTIDNNLIRYYKHGDMENVYSSGQCAGTYVTATKEGAYVNMGTKINFYKSVAQDPNPDPFEKTEFTVEAPTPQSIDSNIDYIEMKKIAVCGKEIYAVYNCKLKGELIRPCNVKIYKGNIDWNNKNISFSDTPIFDTFYSAGGIFDSNFFLITDMQVKDGVLYALILDNAKGPYFTPTDGSGSYSNNHSRGALLKIDSNNITVKGLHNTMLNSTAPSGADQSVEAGNYIYMMKEHDIDDFNNNFLGPRKFIAIKPKKLVIADSGALNSSDNKKLVKKRVVTVNLEDLSFSHVVLTDEQMFEGEGGSYYSTGVYF